MYVKRSVHFENELNSYELIIIIIIIIIIISIFVGRYYRGITDFINVYILWLIAIRKT